MRFRYRDEKIVFLVTVVIISDIGFMEFSRLLLRLDYSCDFSEKTLDLKK